jgi:hypothetical protein
MARATANHSTKPTAFLSAVARIHLSHLFPRVLGGGVAERVLATVEG